MILIVSLSACLSKLCMVDLNIVHSKYHSKNVVNVSVENIHWWPTCGYRLFIKTSPTSNVAYTASYNHYKRICYYSFWKQHPSSSKLHYVKITLTASFNLHVDCCMLESTKIGGRLLLYRYSGYILYIQRFAVR